MKLPKIIRPEVEAAYTSGECYFDILLSRTDMKRVLDFIEVHTEFYRDPEWLLEQVNNIYIRMMPCDIVEVAIT